MEMNVRAAGVSQRFGRTEVLKNVNLSAGRGVFGLLGPNGAGKTPLLRTLATAIEPSAGTLRLLGFDPKDPGERRAFRRRLGYLPQQLGYYPNFTVFEFVEYFALLKEMPDKEVRPAVANSGASVLTEPSISPSRAGCTFCNTNAWSGWCAAGVAGGRGSVMPAV